MTELKCNSKGACRHHEFSEITLDKKCNCYDWWVECDWGKDFNPQPQPDELGKLIEELGNGIYKTDSYVTDAIKLLAERVANLEKIPCHKEYNEVDDGTDKPDSDLRCYVCGTNNFLQSDGITKYAIYISANNKPSIAVCTRCLPIPEEPPLI